MNMDQFTDKMAELAQKLGPAALDATRGVAQTEAYSTLVGGSMSIGVGAIVAIGGWVLFKKSRAMAAEDHIDASFLTAISIVIFVFAAVFALLGIWTWIDPWTWAAIYHPDVYIAKRILKL